MLQKSKRRKFATIYIAKSSIVRKKSRESIRNKSFYYKVCESKSIKLKSVTVFEREFKFSSFRNERAQEKVSCANILVETFSYVPTSRASTTWALFDTGKPYQLATKCGL